MVLDFETVGKLRAKLFLVDPFQIKNDLLESKSVDIKTIAKLWKSFLKYKPDANIDFYFHTPFCLHNKCKFCQYFSKRINSMTDLDNYLDIFEKYVTFFAPIFKGFKFRSLYFGGGTSSIYNVQQLKRLFKLIFGNFQFKDDTDKTFEISFYTATLDKIDIALSYGINRFTMGIQSWDPEVLEKANRVKPVESAIKRIIKFIREKSNAIINLDLMLGLPGDTLDKLKDSIFKTLSLKPDIITLYEFYNTEKVRERNKNDPFYSNYKEPYLIEDVKNLLKEIKSGFPEYHFSLNHTYVLKIYKGDADKTSGYYNTQPLWMLQNSVFGNGPFSQSFIENYFFYMIKDFSDFKNFKITLFYNNNPLIMKLKYIVDYFSIYHKIDIIHYFRTFNSEFEKDFKEAIEFLIKEKKLTKEGNNYVVYPKDTHDLIDICLLFWPEDDLKKRGLI